MILSFNRYIFHHRNFALLTGFQFIAKKTATVYTTDTILSLLMCAPRSVYPWDIIIIREGDHLILDKRDGGPFGQWGFFFL